ncbi:MAG: Gfo/Idh/MocA family oxidoreductase [Pseudomonadota bacterium]|nr:Gfo/Idh/MocA family oxidoreductase [Pseudomonadota bacterium]
MTDRKLQLGVVGLGRAFMLMLPTLAHHPRLRLVAAADPRPEGRAQFAEDFAATSYASVEDLCADPDVEAVYIASPHQFHVEHVARAAEGGKHILVEKPMALSLRDCEAMIAAARKAGVHMIVGHSHSFDAPYLRTRELIAGGAYGAVRMITAVNFTDYLYRPRRPEELDTERGGGAVFSQAPHHIDIVRLLGGGRVKSVRAGTGAWDPRRPTEGAYSTFLTFEDGAFASVTYSGYGRFDTDEFCDWTGEMGQPRNPDEYGAARRLLATVSSPEEEAALKNKRAYGLGASPAKSAPGSAGPLLHNHFGFVLASCERADLRPLPQGVMIYADEARRLDPLPRPEVPRAEVIDELFDAVVLGREPIHTGEWGMATTEVCIALLQSAREGREISLNHQVGVGAQASQPAAAAP